MKKYIKFTYIINLDKTKYNYKLLIGYIKCIIHNKYIK